jgi:hypothetical protein
MMKMMPTLSPSATRIIFFVVTYLCLQLEKFGCLSAFF